MTSGAGEDRKRRRRRAPRPRERDDGLERQLGSGYALRLRHHRLLALGATLAVLGIGLVGIQESFLGGLLVLAGLGALVVRIHLYGRLGEER